MTDFEFSRCDECGKELERCECSRDQLLFTLTANYDTSETLGESHIGFGNEAHFCSKKCLLQYIETRVEEHCDLPIVDVNGIHKGVETK